MPEGVIFGYIGPLVDGGVDVVALIFQLPLKLLVVPLVFVPAAAAAAIPTRMGAMAVKTLALYMLTTAIAISTALGSRLIQPGVGMNTGRAGYLLCPTKHLRSKKSSSIFSRPTPLKAMAEGNMLQIIVFFNPDGYRRIRSAVNRGEKVQQVFNDLNEEVL